MYSYFAKGVSMYFVYIESISMLPMHSSMFKLSTPDSQSTSKYIGVSQGISQGSPQGLLPNSPRGIYLRLPCFLQGSRPQVSVNFCSERIQLIQRLYRFKAGTASKVIFINHNYKPLSQKIRTYMIKNNMQGTRKMPQGVSKHLKVYLSEGMRATFRPSTCRWGQICHHPQVVQGSLICYNP